MEANAGNGLEYWICVESKWVDSLFGLREWSHLKIAFENELIWVRGFSASEINSSKVLSLPFVKRLYSKDGHLVAYGQKLPLRPEPNQLWTPIQRGLRIELPKQNFNFFGIDQQLNVRLIESEKERSVQACLVPLTTLGKYIQDAPDIRLKNLYWTVFEETQALIIGTPILPLLGNDFYVRECFLIPLGYQLEFESLTHHFAKALNEDGRHYVILNLVNAPTKISKNDFVSLSRGSFRKTMEAMKNISQLSSEL